MNENQLSLSDQMRGVLELLDRQGPMTARQINDYVHHLKASGSRRVVAASVSRTVRRLRRRGLISCEGNAIAITQAGRSGLQEAMLTDLRKAVRHAVAQAWAEYEQSQKPKAEAPSDTGSERLVPDHI